jgi:hypothetical protein
MALENVKCILADAPSYSVPAFFNSVAQYNSKKNPDKLSAYLFKQYHSVFSVDAKNYDRCENIREGKYPLLLSAGSLEEQEDILSIIKERNPQPTSILILPGCNHGNGMYKQTEMYQNTIREFTEKYM